MAVEATLRKQQVATRVQVRLQSIGSTSAAPYLHQLMSGVKNVYISQERLRQWKSLFAVCGIRSCQAPVETPSSH